jgi:hypothetical protein
MRDANAACMPPPPRDGAPPPALRHSVRCRVLLATYTSGPLLSTVAAFFRPPLLNPCTCAHMTTNHRTHTHTLLTHLNRSQQRTTRRATTRSRRCTLGRSGRRRRWGWWCIAVVSACLRVTPVRLDRVPTRLSHRLTRGHWRRRQCARLRHRWRRDGCA